MLVQVETRQISTIETGQRPAAVASSVETGQMSAVGTGQLFAAETGQMAPVETRQMLKSQARGVVSFTAKKRLRQDSYQQQGLSNPGVFIFTEKKSACGKLVSSNSACQSPDYGCAMDFSNDKVSFRSDGTPLHRMAVQF